MEKKVLTKLEKATQDLAFIEGKEPLFGEAVYDLISHLASTYKDKYDAGASKLDTKKDLYDPKTGKAVNVYQTKRYLQRYDTDGFAKSEMIIDLKKGIHYMLFEMTRKKMMENDIITNKSVSTFVTVTPTITKNPLTGDKEVLNS